MNFEPRVIPQKAILKHSSMILSYSTLFVYVGQPKAMLPNEDHLSGMTEEAPTIMGENDQKDYVNYQLHQQ